MSKIDPILELVTEARHPARLKRVEAPGGLSCLVRDIGEWLIAFALAVVLSPLLLLITITILAESGRPVIFRQPRFGRGGKCFDVFKFRTMKQTETDVSGANQTADNDPRITRVGRILRVASLDELPQIFNVLRGEMSLVGPRAHPCGMRVEGELCEVVDPRYHSRHVVRPGITGWAQVNGSRGAVKSAEALSRRVDLDLEYIRNWSLLLDARVLIKTVGVALHSGRGS